MINGSEMRGKFTYALGEEEKLFTSFLHDKCRQETGRKELLISGTNRFFFFHPGKAGPGKRLGVAVSSLPFTEDCSAGPTTLCYEQAPFEPSSFISSHKVEKNAKDSIWVKSFIFVFQALLLFTEHLTSMATCQSNKYHSTESPEQPSDPFLTVV